MKVLKNKKIIIILVTIVLMVTISLTVTPKEDSNIFEKAIAFVFSPIRTVVNVPVNGIKDSIAFFVDMKDYKTKNEELTKQNAELTERIRQIENMEKENEELRELLNLKKKYELNNAIVAEVVAKDPSMWFDTFYINKGLADGIEKNMIVLTHNGLVGKISEVYDNTSKIVSILDVGNEVPAKITKTGDTVVTKGDINLKEQGLLKINYITSDVPLSVGDVIETSGIGTIYPKGIYIGTVKEIEKESKKYAIIEPGTNFRTLSEVLIIKNG